MRTFLLTLAALCCAPALATSNPKVDAFVDTALSGLELTSQASPACTLYQQWIEEVTYPRTVTNKIEFSSGAFTTSLSLNNIQRRITENVEADQHTEWESFAEKFSAPDTFRNGIVLFDRFNAPDYSVFLVVVPDAAQQQQAVCYAVLRE